MSTEEELRRQEAAIKELQDESVWWIYALAMILAGLALIGIYHGMRWYAGLV